MSKVRDLKGGRLGPINNNKKKKKDPPKPDQQMVQITLANAPILQAKMAEATAINMREMIVEFKKFNTMFGDVVKMLREKDG